jgi:hypothetical protein
LEAVLAFLVLLAILTDAFGTEGVETFFAGTTDGATASFFAGRGGTAEVDAASFFTGCGGTVAAFLRRCWCLFHTFPIINLLIMVSVISFKKRKSQKFTEEKI